MPDDRSAKPSPDRPDAPDPRRMALTVVGVALAGGVAGSYLATEKFNAPAPPAPETVTEDEPRFARDEVPAEADEPRFAREQAPSS